MYKVLLTCPPMIARIEHYKDILKRKGIEIFIPPNFVQTCSEEELLQLVPDFDGWIVGDDTASQQILEKGKKGKLKAVVKWGIGTDNIDQEACKRLGLFFTNTPGMFNEEVSDVAIGYLLCLTRQLVQIHNRVLQCEWYKPPGYTLINKKIAVVGFGNIGQAVVRKLQGFTTNIMVSDPFYKNSEKGVIEPTVLYPSIANVKVRSLQTALKDAFAVILCCPLNKHTFHLIKKKELEAMKRASFIINVGRGPVLCEKDLLFHLNNGHIQGAALDVFEEEPLSPTSELRQFKNCIFGTHNSSNTYEAVDKTSTKVIEIIHGALR